MFKNNSAPDRLLLFVVVLLSPVFLAAVYRVSMSLRFSGAGTSALITGFLAAALAALYFLFKREGLLDSMLTLILLALPVCVLLLLRLSLFDRVTPDYVTFLSPWGEYLKENGGLAALKNPIGNYNIPYLVFLALVSYLPMYDLYLIKLMSVLFDLVLAFSLMKLVSLYTKSPSKKIVVFLLALLLPTPILNGALWGQCDSIYAAFAVLSLYFALRGRPVLSVAAIALSFAFKLQAIFILPVFLLFMMAGKLKIRHLLVFPAVFFAAVLPAIIAGRPVLDTLTIYSSELGTVGSSLNYNSPSVFSLFWNIQNPELASRLGILAAFSLCVIVFYLALIRRRNLSGKALLSAALIFAIGIPLFLPHMHDRYFFIADMLVLAFAVIYPRYWPTVPLVTFASLLGYHAYLKMRFFLPMSYGFWALSVVFVSLCAFFVYHLFKAKNPPASQIQDGSER